MGTKYKNQKQRGEPHMKTSPVRSETVKKILRPALIVLAVLIVLLNSITIVQAGWPCRRGN